MTLVRQGLPHSLSPLSSSLAQQDPSSDFLAVSVHLASSSLTFLNLYVPPIRSSSQDTRSSFPVSILPDDGRTFIFGDFNAHHPSWDASFSGPDSSGAALFSWLSESSLSSLNDPLSSTFLHPSSGSRSSPDLSLAPSSLSPRCSWSLCPDLGSDHLPISVSVSLQRPSPRNTRPPSFNFSKAHWDVFSSFVTLHCPSPDVYSALSLSKATASFTSLLLDAARSSIPYGRTQHPPKAWWSAEVAEAVQARRRAHASVRPGDPASLRSYNEASARARSVIAAAKQASWQTTCSSLSPRSNPRRVFSLLRSLSDPHSSASRPTPTFPNCPSPSIPLPGLLPSCPPTFLALPLSLTAPRVDAS